MITENEISDLLIEAGEAIPTPDGIDAILEATQVGLHAAGSEPLAPHNRFTSRGFVLKSLGAAAVIALLVSIVVVSSSPIQQTNTPIHAVALTPELGVNASGVAKSAAPSAAKSLGGTSSTSSSPANSEKIITTGTLTLGVAASHLPETVTRLDTIANSLGGFVTHSSVALAGKSRGGTVTLSVPAKEFQKAINAAEALGTVKHLGTTATDVTGQVADLGAQLSALEAARTQLKALLARAGSVSALLQVQNEITDTQTQIQQLQAQQRVLSSQIEYSSLSVTIAPPAKQATPPRSGFSKAWHDAITHFVNGLSSFVADSGVVLFAVLLVALIAFLLVLLGRMAWSIIRRRLL